MDAGQAAPKASNARTALGCCAGILQVAAGDGAGTGDFSFGRAAACQSRSGQRRVRGASHRKPLAFLPFAQRMTGVYLSRWVFILI
jgi:hypothetical protein